MRYIVLTILLFVSPALLPQGSPVPSSEVEAVFLFNFTGFVDWPVSSFASADAPLVIGVLGDNPFGAYLQETVRNEKKETHPLIIKYFARIEDVKDCQILFVNKQGSQECQQVLGAVKGRNILTVGDAQEFTKNGGMIGFFIDKNKVRFRINMDAVKQSNLVISSKMLRLAEVLNGK